MLIPKWLNTYFSFSSFHKRSIQRIGQNQYATSNVKKKVNKSSLGRYIMTAIIRFWESGQSRFNPLFKSLVPFLA